MLVASLVLGIVSVVFAFIPIPFVAQTIGLILGVVAIILSASGRKKEPEKKGVATAGLVLGIIGAALSLIFLIAAIIAAAAVASLGGAMLNSKEMQDALNQIQDALASPSPAAQ